MVVVVSEAGEQREFEQVTEMRKTCGWKVNVWASDFIGGVTSMMKKNRDNLWRRSDISNLNTIPW